MRKPWLAILSLAAAPVFGQVASPTLTITATRSVTPQPNDVAFELTVSSGATASLDQILAALSGLGITTADLASVFNSASQPFQWSFTLAVPIAKLNTTIGSLTQLQQNIGQNNSGLTLTFTVVGTLASQLSQQMQQSQPCSNTELIADATAQGQKVAAAAGFTLGPILTLSKAANPAYLNFIIENGSFLTGYIVPSIYFSGSVSPLTCSLVVQFQLQP
jgi:hypothetical protein